VGVLRRRVVAGMGMLRRRVVAGLLVASCASSARYHREYASIKAALPMTQ
jgi:hypothetical protein